MSEKNLKVEIISPEAVIFNGNCNMAVVQTLSGEIGFMAFHETLITKLAAGKIELFDEKSNSIKSFEINGGYGQMQTEDHLLLIVEN